GTRANVPQDHERGRFLRPTFHPIGALSTLADCFEVQIVDQTRGELKTAPRGQILFQPRWQAGAWRRRGIERDELHRLYSCADSKLYQSRTSRESRGTHWLRKHQKKAERRTPKIESTTMSGSSRRIVAPGTNTKSSRRSSAASCWSAAK